VAISHDVSDPDGTSEYARLKKAVAPGDNVTGEAEKFVKE
jgi:hypothetical protein